MQSTALPMHVRVKRKNQTFFIPSTPSTTIESLKTQISKILSLDEQPKMRIYKGSSSSTGDVDLSNNTNMEYVPLSDVSTLSDHKIDNDSVLFVVLRRQGKENEEEDAMDGNDLWEDVDIFIPPSDE